MPKFKTKDVTPIIVFARAGKPVARLVPIERQTAQRIPGSAKGKLVIADDFDAPLPEDILSGLLSGPF
jgi:antitoxin (DNA-binding transcriptional repressor) of toxin-antitoxin stability system